MCVLSFTSSFWYVTITTTLECLNRIWWQVHKSLEEIILHICHLKAGVVGYPLHFTVWSIFDDYCCFIHELRVKIVLVALMVFKRPIQYDKLLLFFCIANILGIMHVAIQSLICFKMFSWMFLEKQVAHLLQMYGFTNNSTFLVLFYK